jgi:hypothetical protein
VGHDRSLIEEKGNATSTYTDDKMIELAWVKTLTLLTGIVIAGEALALVLGMHVLSPTNNPWMSLKNDLLLGLDIVVGVGLVIAANHGSPRASTVLYVLVATALVTHGYREGEVLARVGNAFCANAPLFAMNTLKLVGLLFIAGGTHCSIVPHLC